jgi:hypothetical protein
MSKTASEIVERALLLVDEQLTEIADAASTEMSLKDMALKILPDVSRDLVKELPYELKRYLAKSGAPTIDTLANGEDQGNYTKQKVAFISPSDFWELVSMRLTVWAKPVTSYILIDSPEYSAQNNPFTRSGKQNPAVAISNTTSGGNSRIEAFSVNDGDASTIGVFEYVSFDNVPDDLGNDWPDEIFDEITKALASQLELIKDRIEKGAVRGEETLRAIEQHD